MAATIDLRRPGGGAWRVLNSPADRVPSHGTTRWASSYAIDLVPVDSCGRSAPISLRTLVRTEPAGRFVGFGRPILAPASGVVLAVRGGQPDHAAHRGVPSVLYALGQGRRARGGWRAVAGNHVLLDVGGIVVALCHLRREGIAVDPGAHVEVGEAIGACGNSGNSTEPHLHLQAMDDPDPDRARAVPLTLEGVLPSGGTILGS